MKRILKNIIILISVLILSTSLAYGSAYSNWKYTGKINGHYYKYRSGLMIYSKKVQARAHTEEKNDKRVQAGTFGVRTFLYKSTGALFKSSDWEYNDSSCIGIDYPGAETGIKGTYYCVAKFKYYNGNGYTGTYTGYQSPNGTVRGNTTVNLNLNSQIEVADADISELKRVIPKTVEINGLTYGSGLVECFGEDMPDMVLACGENDLVGYVSAEELAGNDAKTLSAAMAQNVKEGEQSVRRIPLYNVQGEVIGCYVIETKGCIGIQKAEDAERQE